MSCNTCAVSDIYDTDEIRHGKLDSFDWLSNIDEAKEISGLVEVHFKNTRKGFFQNTHGLTIKRGDRVVVEAIRGHDLGIVSLMGDVAQLQYARKLGSLSNVPILKIYRKATEADTDKWRTSRLMENPTLVKSHQLASKLGLEMKISSVEYQADGRKATFYYTADSRVDFRQLIKDLSAEYSILVEMKQIGARQEAGMIGGIGSCGRSLCCSTWRTDFSSITTDLARLQELPINAQKLAGQCGKLKCCLTYELDQYLEAKEDFPKMLLELELDKGRAMPIKTDVLKKQITYSYDPGTGTKHFMLDLERVKKIINQNKRGQKPAMDELSSTAKPENTDVFMSGSVSLNLAKRKKKKRRAPVRR